VIKGRWLYIDFGIRKPWELTRNRHPKNLKNKKNSAKIKSLCGVLRFLPTPQRLSVNVLSIEHL
jgi:hypothetical protein